MTFYTEDISSGTNWKGFERIIARLMGHLGWKDVSIIGGSGDKGGDILGVNSDSGTNIPWVVQAKSISGDRYVGPQAMNEAIAALSFYETKVAAVATNGNFTNTAIKRQKQLEKNGFTLKLWNGIFLKEMFKRMPSNHARLKELREYQEKIVKKAVDIFDNGGKRAYYIVATGLGKTIIAATIAQQLWARGHKRILVLCHAIDLAQQLEQSFWSQITKDVPTTVFFDGLPPRTTEGITFGLYQSLYGYLPGIDPDQFDVVIVDEAHHAPAFGFRKCLNHLTPKFIIGMTATPWRGDGQNPTEFFGEPIEKVSLVDGMSMGYLSKVDYRIMCDNVDWKEIPRISKKSLSIKDLNKRLFMPQRDEAVIAEIVKTAKETPAPRIAIFSPSVEHSKRFAQMLFAGGIPSVSLSDVDKAERRKRLLAFSSGTYTAVTAVDVMNEGIDIPDVNILVFLRATHSRRIFVQQLGRGLRISEGKEKTIVLDFVSDLKRMAEVVEMNNEGKQKGQEKEILFLKNGFVKFSDAKVESFINAWIQDVTDLGDANDDTKLTFPEGIEW